MGFRPSTNDTIDFPRPQFDFQLEEERPFGSAWRFENFEIITNGVAFVPEPGILLLLIVDLFGLVIVGFNTNKSQIRS